MLILNYSIIPPASKSQETDRRRDRQRGRWCPMMMSRGKKRGQRWVSELFVGYPGVKPNEYAHACPHGREGNSQGVSHG